MLCLPPELQQVVLSSLDPPSLAKFARTCRSLYPVALRALYRHLCVSTATSVVLTLASRPDIARHVRSFHLVLHGTFFRSFYRRLAAALSAMTALVSLGLSVDSECSWVLPDSHVYPQLQYFTSTFPLDSHLAIFLANAPALRSVHIESVALMPPTFVHGSLPRLVEFTGCPAAAAVLVPGRPVKSIHVNSGDLTENMVPALGRSTELVTVLSVTTDSAPVILLQVLGQHLPHLMYLRITSTRNFLAPPTPIFHEQVADTLSLFADLQSFELWGMYWPSSKKPENQQRVWQAQPLTNFTPAGVDAYTEDYIS